MDFLPSFLTRFMQRYERFLEVLDQWFLTDLCVMDHAYCIRVWSQNTVERSVANAFRKIFRFVLNRDFRAARAVVNLALHVKARLSGSS